MSNIHAGMSQFSWLNLFMKEWFSVQICTSKPRKTRSLYNKMTKTKHNTIIMSKKREKSWKNEKNNAWKCHSFLMYIWHLVKVNTTENSLSERIWAWKKMYNFHSDNLFSIKPVQIQCHIVPWTRHWRHCTYCWHCQWHWHFDHPGVCVADQKSLSLK